MGDRALTKKEERFFDKWTNEWAMPFELMAYAFDIAVDRTGKPGLEYMSKILSDWHAGGITTVDQAEAASAEYRRVTAETRTRLPKEGEGAEASSFDTDEFFEKALKRSYAMMNGGGE